MRRKLSTFPTVAAPLLVPNVYGVFGCISNRISLVMMPADPRQFFLASCERLDFRKSFVRQCHVMSYASPCLVEKASSTCMFLNSSEPLFLLSAFASRHSPSVLDKRENTVREKPIFQTEFYMRNVTDTTQSPPKCI